TKQLDFVHTIHESGRDVLALINDILDLSNIESGTVTLELDDLALSQLVGHLERTFRPVADSRGLGFTVEVEPGLPATFRTDGKRLEQVLKNLLSNAFKFTEQGHVRLSIHRPPES